MGDDFDAWQCTCTRLAKYLVLVLTFAAAVIYSVYFLAQNNYNYNYFHYNDDVPQRHHWISLKALWKADLEEAVATAAATCSRNASTFSAAVGYHSPSPTTKRLRVAIISPDSVIALYTKTSPLNRSEPNPTCEEFVKSTYRRWGPLGLFDPNYFDTSRYILYVNFSDRSVIQFAEPNTDCSYANGGIKPDLSVPINLPQRPPQGYSLRHSGATDSINLTALAVPEDSVDWGQFDIVISYSPAVSSSLTRQYPTTLWCYYIIEGCQRSYAESRKQVIDGWDYFLTQDYNFNTAPEPSHVIQFPHTFARHNHLPTLLNISNPYKKEGAIVLTGYSFFPKDDLDYLQSQLGSIMTIRPMSGTTQAYMEEQMRSKYAIFWKQTKRGNAIAESLASGVLVLGDVSHIIDRQVVMTTGLFITEIQALVNMIRRMENDDEIYQFYLARQREIFNLLSFESPMQEIIRKGKVKMLKRVALPTNSSSSGSSSYSRLEQISPLNWQSWH